MGLWEAGVAGKIPESVGLWGGAQEQGNPRLRGSPRSGGLWGHQEQGRSPQVWGCGGGAQEEGTPRSGGDPQKCGAKEGGAVPRSREPPGV